VLIGFRLAWRHSPDGRLILAVPLAYRLLLAAIGVFVLCSLLATSPGGGLFTAGNLAPLLFSLLGLLGAAYEERWVFDRARDLLLRQNGLWPLRFSRRLELARLREVAFEQVARGRQRGARQRPLTVLLLLDRDGLIYRLEQFSVSQLPRARRLAQAIASYCGIPFRD
jgi:hypothetical protein